TRHGDTAKLDMALDLDVHTLGDDDLHLAKDGMDPQHVQSLAKPRHAHIKAQLTKHSGGLHLWAKIPKDSTTIHLTKQAGDPMDAARLATWFRGGRRRHT